MTYNEDYDAQETARKEAERGASADPADHPGAGAMQDKAAINAGFTGDKVAGMDLAASPLGTDSEAGGDTPESGDRARAGGEVSGSTARDPNRANAVRPPVPWIWIVLAVAAAAVLGFLLLVSVT